MGHCWVPSKRDLPVANSIALNALTKVPFFSIVQGKPSSTNNRTASDLNLCSRNQTPRGSWVHQHSDPPVYRPRAPKSNHNPCRFWSLPARQRRQPQYQEWRDPQQNEDVINQATRQPYQRKSAHRQYCPGLERKTFPHKTVDIPLLGPPRPSDRFLSTTSACRHCRSLVTFSSRPNVARHRIPSQPS